MIDKLTYWTLVNLSYHTISQLCCGIFVDAPVSAAECQREVRVIGEHDVDHNNQLHAASDQHQDVHAGAGWAAEEARQRDGELQRSSGELFLLSCSRSEGWEINK